MEKADLGVQLTEIAFGLWLAAVAAEDYKSKKVKIWHIAAALSAGILYAVLYRYIKEDNLLTGFFCLLEDVIPGLVLCLLSALTKNGIGMGDALVAMVMGVYMGARFAAICLCTAFFLVFPLALLLCCFKKKKKTAAIPFLPSLFTGYVLIIL